MKFQKIAINRKPHRTMKKILFVTTLLVLSSKIMGQTAPQGSYADIISHFINAGTNNFDDLYDGYIPTNIPYTETNYVNVETGVMDSSYSYLVSISQNKPNCAKSEFRINYCESSNYHKKVKIKKILEETQKYFDEKSKSPEYKVVQGKSKLGYKRNYYLYKKELLLSSYHYKRDESQSYDKNTEGDFCIIFYEQPRLKLFVDEAIYHGIFPAEPSATTEPQVWEQKTVVNGVEQTYHWNGIFTSDGSLKAGTKYFHGFGPYYDGTWYSDNWEYGNVKFVPEGTNDVVCGIFKNGKTVFYDFYVMDNLVDKFKDAIEYFQKTTYSYTTNYNCNWIKNTYNPYDEARKKELNELRIIRNDSIQAHLAKNHTNHSDEFETKKTGILTFCKFCNGTGKVESSVTKGTQYETTYYKSCTKCVGKGSWMQY